MWIQCKHCPDIVSTSRGTASVVQPLGLKWKGASIWVPTCSLIEMLYCFKLLQLQQKTAHMRDEAVHGVVCSLTDRALPAMFFCLEVPCVWPPERMISRPNTLILLRKWVSQINETHGAVKKRGGVRLSVVYPFKSTSSHISHGGIVEWGEMSAFRLEIRHSSRQSACGVAVRTECQCYKNKDKH